MAHGENRSDKSAVQHHQQAHPRPSSDESTPLLVPTGESITSSTSTPLLAPPVEDANATPKHKIPRTRVYLFCFGIILLIECVAVSMALSQNVILESILCQRYHASSLPLESSRIDRFFRAEHHHVCKSKDVQSRLAFLRGWFLLAEVLPGIFTAIPYGFVADKYGRKLVLFLSVGGFALCAVWVWSVLWWAEYVNEAWLLAGGLFALIGGGGPIFTSMIFTTVADVTGEKERASIFFQLGSCVLIGAVAFTPLASFLESRNIWFPVVLNLVSVVLAMVFILFIPETLHLRDCGPPTADLCEEESSDADKVHDRPSYFMQQASSGLAHMAAAAKFAIADLNIALLLFSFIFSTLGRWAGETILQYATKRFQLSWAQANYLMAIPAIATLSTFVVFLPLLSYLLTSSYFSVPALKKDFILSRISILLLLVGALIVGFATHEIGMSIGLVFQGAGTGFNILVRSVLTSMVEQHHIGMLYNCIVIFENIGIITAGPLMANALRLGIEWDGIWLGMPYFVAAGFFTIASGMVLMADIEGYPKTQHIEREEQDRS